MSGSESLFATLGAVLTMGLFALPADLLTGAGRAWLFPLLLNIGLTLFSAWVYIRLGTTFPGQTLLDYTPRILGRFGGWGVPAIYWAFHLYLNAVATESFVRALHPFVLFFTPSGVIAAILLLPSAYLAGLGLKGLARASVVVVPVAYLLFLLPIVLSFSNAEYLNLRPSAGPGPGATLLAATSTYYPFISFDLTLLYTAFWDHPRRHARLLYWAVGAASFVLLLHVAAVVATLGVNLPQRLVWPSLVLAEVTRFPGFFIERLGFMIVISRIALGCLFMATQLWALSFTVMHKFRPRRALFRPLIIVLALASYVGAGLIGDQESLEGQLRNVISPAGLALVIVLPAIMLLVARIRGFRSRPDEPVPSPGVPAAATAAATAGASAPPTPPALERTAPTGDAPPAGGKGASGRKSRAAGRTRRAGRGRAPARR